MPPSEINSDLLALRATIDDIDANIIGLLGQRFEVTKKVGAIKAALNLTALDAEREAAQRSRYAELAIQSGVNEPLIQEIFRILISRVVENHQAQARKWNQPSE